jgi:tetratricopeptide (TPR) repeat protein
MRRTLICVLVILITSAAFISAQDGNSALVPLSELSRRNQLPQLIRTANSLLASAKLTPIEQGVVLTYLGHAYQQLGDFHNATAHYDKALAIFERDGQHSSEYATTLGTLATLYAETGQVDTAKHVLLRSLHFFEKDGAHYAEIAMIWNDLASMAADRHSSHEAHKCMARSIAESQLSSDISPNELAALTTTQARIAEMDGDPNSAISEYQRSLALWKQSHDDQHPDTAWLYVLLGEAYLQAGQIAKARETTGRGLSLLETSAGRQSTRFLDAELSYAKILEVSGEQDEASSLRKEAETGLKTRAQSSKGEISVAALR